VNQIVSVLILLKKPNTGLSRFIKKKQKNGTDRIQTPVTGVAAHTLSVEPRQHSAAVVYYTYFTHFRVLKLI